MRISRSLVLLALNLQKKAVMPTAVKAEGARPARVSRPVQESAPPRDRVHGWAGNHVRRLQRYYWIIPATITFAVTFIGAARPSLWGDELATWSAARRSWSQLWRLFDHMDVVFAPYYIFMHGWMWLFGNSELALRMPSILAVTVTAALLSVLGHRLFSTRVGLFAGVLFSVLPGVSRTGQDARIAAFSAMFAVLATLALLAVLDAPRWWRWLMYSASVVALGATSLIALLLLAAHGALVAQRWWVTRHRQLAWWLASAAGALLVLSPLAYLGHQQVGQLTWVPKPGWAAFPDAFGIAGPVALGCALFAVGLVGIKRAGRVRGLLAAWLLVPPVLLYCISLFGPQSYWVARYMYFVLPVLVLLVALVLASMNVRYPAIFFVVLVLFAAPMHTAIRSDAGHYSFNGPAVAGYVSSRLQPGDVALFADQSSADPRNLLRYYGPPASELPDGLAIKSAAEIGRLVPKECVDVTRCLAGVPRAWLFLRYFSGNDPFYRILPAKKSFLRENFAIAHTQKIGAITVFLLERRIAS
ncbi:MAG: hypothetical protein DLM55_12430 [Acidimicrobiales bacterium]|nr:MAG: hypothetical protein DLM55_12430 [Acidimicrobiales bacterium]